MAKKLLFIYNPHAGKSMIRTNLTDIIDVFTKGGYDVLAHPTQARGDATALTQTEAGNYDLVVCSGGDGTLDEVVTGMMKREEHVPIGYIPAGSTNDFARSLKISNNMTKAAMDIVDGRHYLCDVGRFNDDSFVYVAGFGLFTNVSYETNQDIKNVLGHLAYLLEGARQISQIPVFHMHVRSEGREYEGEYMYGMVTNSRSVGGFPSRDRKNVDLNDGLFEVMLIKAPSSLIEMNLILRSVVSRKIHTDYMQFFRSAHVEFESDGEVPWTLDGEFGGNHKEVVIDNEFQKLHLIIPKDPFHEGEDDGLEGSL
ncbi:MAG: YegS/Rv2252/BmrU family lipid kinase [Lachnospiraceae bacterium]|nr:YegS/Rv2252/BmrU family lipid kinase [Lachnospiraceae bacterium]